VIEILLIEFGKGFLLGTIYHYFEVFLGVKKIFIALLLIGLFTIFVGLSINVSIIIKSLESTISWNYVAFFLGWLPSKLLGGFLGRTWKEAS